MNALARYSNSFSEISLSEERQLIAHAQKGSPKCVDELVLRHIGFVRFRINRRLLPPYRNRFGEDFLSDAIPILYGKIKTYNLKYRRKGKLKPVRFSSYIWKRIDGFIIDSAKKELRREQMEMVGLERYF